MTILRRFAAFNEADRNGALDLLRHDIAQRSAAKRLAWHGGIPPRYLLCQVMLNITSRSSMFERFVLGAVSAVAALVVVLSMVEIISVLLS